MKESIFLSKRFCKFGAPVGRGNILPYNLQDNHLLHLQKLKWTDYNYTSDGTYWGGGDSLGDIYCAFDAPQGDIMMFVRAKTREGAKCKIRETLPRAFFHFSVNEKIERNKLIKVKTPTTNPELYDY